MNDNTTPTMHRITVEELDQHEELSRLVLHYDRVPGDGAEAPPSAACTNGLDVFELYKICVELPERSQDEVRGVAAQLLEVASVIIDDLRTKGIDGISFHPVDEDQEEQENEVTSAPAPHRRKPPIT